MHRSSVLLIALISMSLFASACAPTPNSGDDDAPQSESDARAFADKVLSQMRNAETKPVWQVMLDDKDGSIWRGDSIEDLEDYNADAHPMLKRTYELQRQRYPDLPDVDFPAGAKALTPEQAFVSLMDNQHPLVAPRWTLSSMSSVPEEEREEFLDEEALANAYLKGIGATIQDMMHPASVQDSLGLIYSDRWAFDRIEQHDSESLPLKDASALRVVYRLPGIEEVYQRWLELHVLMQESPSGWGLVKVIVGPSEFMLP